jgi:hypothetical protein
MIKSIITATSLTAYKTGSDGHITVIVQLMGSNPYNIDIRENSS